MKLPHYPWYPDDYLSSPWVMTCDLADEGIYRRLLDYQWKSPGCQLPDDISYLRRLCKHARKERIIKVLQENFERIEVEKGKFFYRNLRLYTEFCKALRLSQEQTNKANLRWNKEKAHATAMPLHIPEPCPTGNAPQNQNHIHKESKSIRANFVPPTLAQVQDYILERGSKVDPVKFFNYYLSNGWKVGKNKMKDWHAAVRTWERNGDNNDKKSFFQSDRDEQESIKSRSRALLRGRFDLAGNHDKGKMELGDGTVTIQGEVVEVPEVETSED